MQTLCPRVGGPVLSCSSSSSPPQLHVQAALALTITTTLAKVSSAQCAAGTSVPSFQHEGDCVSPPRAQSIWESLGYQHAVLEGEHVEVRVTLPHSFSEGLHKAALWS